VNIKPQWEFFLFILLVAIGGSLIFFAESRSRNVRELIEAASQGDVEKVRSLLDSGMDVNARDKHGKDALNGSLIYNHTNVLKVLLEHGANVDGVKGQVALDLACHEGNSEAVKLLLNHGVEMTLPAAASLGDLKQVEDLIEKGHALDEESFGMTALSAAIRKRNADVVKLLLDKGLDVNATASRRTALEMACAEGNTLIVDLLLQRGANVNQLLGLTAEVKSMDPCRMTALMYAAYKGNLDLVELLVARGADVHAKNPCGETALAYAELGESEMRSPGGNYRKICEFLEHVK
jgi:ankyrin repeat protein